MASKRIATALGGAGYAPGYGTVKNPKKTGLIGSGGPVNSMRTSAKLATSFRPSTPSAAAASTAPAAAAAAPASAALPVDPTYDAQIGAYGRSRDDTIAGLEGQKTANLLGYGYTATYDSAGKVSALAYDPNNPYSQAALARTVYQQQKTGTDNGMAARGQLYSGARTNAQNANDTNFNVGENGRQTALINFLNGVQGQERLANDTYDSNFAQAGADRITRASDNPNYTPAPAATTAPSTADLIKQWAAAGVAGTNVKTTYTNSGGHPVRVLGNGTKQVSTDGGKTWRNV